MGGSASSVRVMSADATGRVPVALPGPVPAEVPTVMSGATSGEVPGAVSGVMSGVRSVGVPVEVSVGKLAGGSVRRLPARRIGPGPDPTGPGRPVRHAA
ncbi:MAG: hypothetical protein QOG76_2831, partial [Pseudonocardiales bacterium]|nr:hypothetical protein [Pseudonocardiales bacterium]